MSARLRKALMRHRGLNAALAASVVLLLLPAAGRADTSTKPVPAAMAWPGVQRGSTPASLPDGGAYQPAMFLDARTSVGTAPSPDGKSLRLLIVAAGRPARQLRSMPFGQGPSYQAFAVSGDVLIWAQGTRNKIQIWRAGLRDRKPPRELTADAGAAAFYGSQYDLTVNQGSLYWTVPGPTATEIRSMALTGGPVHTRAVPGRWALSAWPWLVDGITASGGTTLLKNITTGQESRVAGAASRSVTQCSPTWCRVTRLTRDGATRIDLMHPDGTARRQVAGKTAQTVIVDVAALDRFEVLAQLGANSDLTGNSQLVVVEIATRRTVEISPDANRVTYRNGVLSWSTGNLQTYIWHAVDLRTV